MNRRKIFLNVYSLSSGQSFTTTAPNELCMTIRLYYRLGSGCGNPTEVGALFTTTYLTLSLTLTVTLTLLTLTVTVRVTLTLTLQHANAVLKKGLPNPTNPTNPNTGTVVNEAPTSAG